LVIGKQCSAGQQSLVLDGSVSWESHSEVVSVRVHRSAVTSSLLLERSDDHTTSACELEVDSLAWSAWVVTAQDTSLTALGNSLVSKSVGLVVDVKVVVTVAELEWTDDLADVFSLATFNVVDVDHWSGEAEESASAWSFELEERSVVDLWVSVSELDDHLEWSAVTSQDLSGAPVRLFLSSEDLNTSLLTSLVEVVDEVGVLSLTATEDLSNIDLLLDIDTSLVGESFHTRRGLSRGSNILWLRRILWRIATLLRRILWRVATLLRRILGMSTLHKDKRL